MKKVTLSAAILALAMMGCSDAGLDNSVASAPASEVKSEQTHNFLAKFAIGVLEGTNEWFIVKHGETLEQLWEIFDNRHAHWKKIAMGEV